MTDVCTVCEQRPASLKVDLTAVVRRRARMWRLRCCEDCWRAFEATIELGSEAIQAQLGDKVRSWSWWR